MESRKLVVVAFGGNALLKAGEKGTFEEQKENVKATCNSLIPLLKQGYHLVIGHGNGPQVGNILLQVQAGEKMFGVPQMPMDVCGAYSQGLIGYLIEQQFRNVLATNGIQKDIITFLTQVVVDKNDKAFQNPKKPIGPYYTEEEMEILKKKNPADVFAKDPKGKGWRKVVASPDPIDILNKHHVEALAREGNIVVTVGGGGIPVHYQEEGQLKGIDAVIDKDLASATLAVHIKADEFYILTDVPKVCLNFHTKDEKMLDVITVSEAKKYLSEGHFTEGSMAPKIRAALKFLENGGKKCIITMAANFEKNEKGTEIVHDK